MEIKIQIQRLNELVKAFEQAPEIVKQEIKLALLVSMRDIQRRARSEHRFRSRTGNTERSIDTQIISDWPAKGRVFIDPAVTMTASGKSYGVMIHDGTRPHVIKPRFKRALRWAGGNGFIFSRGVNHPGTAPDPFVYKAGENERENINATFNRYTESALRKAGL